MLKITELEGFMSGGVMSPDPITMKFGNSGIHWAKGGAKTPGDPNGDFGSEWVQEANITEKVANDTIWTTFTPNPLYDKYAGGTVPGLTADDFSDFSPTGSNVTITLFQQATIYIRIEGLTIRFFHSGASASRVNSSVGYAIRVNGRVNMGALMGGFSGQDGYGYYRFFDDSRGYAVQNDDKMRIPARRMNSNQTAVCAHVSTWEDGTTNGTPRIGDGNGNWSVYSPMAFCCSSTHAITLPAGRHTIGVDVFCSANGNACATYNGYAYSTVETLKGGFMTVSSINRGYGDVGAGIIDLTGTAYDKDATYPYPTPGGVFMHAESDAYNSSAINNEINTQAGGGGAGGSGFASDQVTMNRVCALLHAPGSEARNIGARSYDSPKNNSIVKYTNGQWERINAKSYNSHLSSSFQCTDPVPPNNNYYGVWKQGANARITYTAPTGYFYPVWDAGFCEGGGGGGSGDPNSGGGGGPLGGGGGGCFKAGTLISMANGTRKPIEMISVGDKVLGAYLPGVPLGDDQRRLAEWTMQNSALEITEHTVTQNMGGRRFGYHLKINNGLLPLTPDHPILVDRGSTTSFVSAGLLVIGDLMYNVSGTMERVETIERIDEETEYFNFATDGSHNYIANGIVAHNTFISYESNRDGSLLNK